MDKLSLQASSPTAQASSSTQAPSNRYEVVGRSFFHPNLGDAGELGNGLEYWKGFYQSLRPTQMGLSLNIDMSARAFFEPILVSEYVAKYLNKDLSRPLSNPDRVKVRKALRGLKVEISHQGHVKRYKVAGLTRKPAQQMMFTLDATSTRVSVAQYFRQRYNIILKYPNLPAIQVGNDAKPNYIPMEVCRIVEGQRYSKKLNERQVTALLRAICQQRPQDRRNSIKKMVDQNNYNNDPLVNKEFGIDVRPELTSIEARVLPPPLLKYHETGREKLVSPSVGQWNMIDKKMVNGGRVDYWTCVSFSRFNLDIGRFCDELINMCVSKGMVFNNTPLIPVRSAHANNIEKALCDIEADCSRNLKSLKVEGRQLQLLIIILPDVSGSYGTIKRICETELGIVSQCCQPRQASKFSKQYMENVALKINVKVGGRNTVPEQAMAGNIAVPATITTFKSSDITAFANAFNSGEAIVKNLAEIRTYNEAGVFWVCATILEVEILADWFYLACPKCSKKLIPQNGVMFCEKCVKVERSGNYRYKIEVTVQDESGFARFLLWDKESFDLIGKTAGEIKSSNTEAFDFLPKEIEEALSDRVGLFKIQVREGDNRRSSVTYSVMKMTDDAKILSLFKEKYVVNKQVLPICTIADEGTTEETNVNCCENEKHETDGEDDHPLIKRVAKDDGSGSSSTKRKKKMIKKTEVKCME